MDSWDGAHMYRLHGAKDICEPQVQGGSGPMRGFSVRPGSHFCPHSYIGYDDTSSQ